MHGVQPRPNRKPSRARRQADRGHRVHAPVALERRHQPGEDQAQHDREDAEHDGELAPPGRPARRRSRRRARRAARTRRRSRARTAPTRRASGRGVRLGSEVGARQAGGVGEVARQQRDHARREERHQAGDQGDRDGEQQRAGQRLLAGTTQPSARSPPVDVLDELDQGRRRGQPPMMLAATRPSASSTTKPGIECAVERPGEGEHRLAVGRVERRVGDVEACARTPARWPVHASRMLRPTNWTSSPSSSAAATTSGASARHGAHHEPQTTTTTGLPR